jgi:hypothetical protein
MKTYIPYSLILAAASCGLAFGAATAYTTPVGYTTTTLKPGIFNLVGTTVHNPTVAAGVLDAVSASSVTDNNIDFTTLPLASGATYILELGDGTVQEITSWAGGVLTTPDNLTGVVTPSTTTYSLRKASTVAEIFGATNAAGLTASVEGDFSTNTDLLLIYNGTSFDTVYYFDDGVGTTGWFDTVGNPAEDKVVAFPDGFFVQRVAGSDIDLVVSGEVKVTPTGGLLAPGYNYLNGVAPAGLTLGSSGLSAYVLASADGDFTLVDNLLTQNTDGSYTTNYYFDDGVGTLGWFDTVGNPTDAEPLDGGFLLFNVGGSKPYVITAPAIAP